MIVVISRDNKTVGLLEQADGGSGAGVGEVLLVAQLCVGEVSRKGVVHLDEGILQDNLQVALLALQPKIDELGHVLVAAVVVRGSLC